jgi:hypothetical protein
MIDDAIDKLSSNEDGQQADVGALVHDGAKTNDTAEFKASSPKKRVAQGAINRTRRRQLRNRCEPDANEWSDNNDQQVVKTVLTPSFKEILRCAMKVDPDDRDYLELVQSSFLERLAIAKQDFESTNAPTAFKHLLRLQAKLAVIAIVLSAETQEAVERVHANF